MTKTLLVKAPEGKGYHLSNQSPKVYVSGRPHVVQNDPQVQRASAQGALEILGETNKTDEEFLTAYEKDSDKALKDAIVDDSSADAGAAEKAAEEAKRAKAEKARIEKEEAARLKAEAETRKKAEAEHKAQLEAEAARAAGTNED